jgi:GTP:adenosylcobinamide-phosphate guanylyltransferase
VLAGGNNKPEVEAATGVLSRALTPLFGRPMLDYVVDALAAAESVSDIIVIGNVPVSSNARQVPDQCGFVENLYAGLEATSGDPVLIATSDIPFLTSESIEDFLDRGAAAGADIVYPIVRVEDCYTRFPGLNRTVVRLKEGEFTGGNAMLVRRKFMEAQRARLARAYALRKNPLKLAMMVGIGVTLKLALTVATRRPMLSIPELEGSISRVLGGSARGLISRYPELATDVDRLSDLEAAEKFKTRIRPGA